MKSQTLLLMTSLGLIACSKDHSPMDAIHAQPVRDVTQVGGGTSNPQSVDCSQPIPIKLTNTLPLSAGYNVVLNGQHLAIGRIDPTETIVEEPAVADACSNSTFDTSTEFTVTPTPDTVALVQCPVTTLTKTAKGFTQVEFILKPSGSGFSCETVHQP